MTGLSGSGKTVALRAIEDSGFYCVDNLPTRLIDKFIGLASQREDRPNVGIGIDIREKMLLRDMESPKISALRKKYNIMILFLEADAPTLVRRYKESRRPHPMKGESIEASIEAERLMVEPMRAMADRVVDTSALNPHQLKDLVKSLLGLKGAGFHLVVMSFGYKYGVPQNADLIFDARFLPNPHFVPELKELCGLDEPVRDFVLNGGLARDFLRRLEDMLGFLIPNYRKEGKFSLTIGIGCTGGRHRSPAVAAFLAPRLKGLGQPVEIIHRDI